MSPLRLHLATLLLDADRPQEALEQCAPDSEPASRTTGKPCGKPPTPHLRSGDTVRAVSYGRLLDALGSSPGG